MNKHNARYISCIWKDADNVSVFGFFKFSNKELINIFMYFLAAKPYCLNMDENVS